MSGDVAMHSEDYHNDGREQTSAINGHAVPKDQDCDMSDDDVPLVSNSYFIRDTFPPDLPFLLVSINSKGRHVVSSSKPEAQETPIR